MSNDTSCSGWQLYVIVDQDAVAGRDLAWIAEQAIRGGADVIQLRAKAASTRDLIEHAQRLREVTQAGKVPLVINDRVDVALAVGAEGVHLGQDDLPVAVARRLLGPGRILGKSTHTLDQAREADRDGVDYLAVGPIFSTPTKPDSPHVGLRLIRDVKAHVQRPMVAIGGIDLTTLSEVMAAGAQCVAVVRAVSAAGDPATAARDLKRLLIQHARTQSVSKL